MPKRVFITGGTGYIGRALVRALWARGDRPIVLSRDIERARARLPDRRRVDIVVGDPTAPGPWQDAVVGADAVVNLAGEPLDAHRWNAQFRQRLHDSRVDATRFVVEALSAAEPSERPAVLVSASGVDYYPFDVDLGAHADFGDDDEVTEECPRGESFLARLCRDWEAEAREASALGVRVVLMRCGLVFGPGGGGAQNKLAKPFRLWVGGRIGNGRQWVSWIHLDDVVAAYLFAIDRNDLTGPVNLVAPEPVRNRDLARALGKALGRPAWLPAPALAVRAVAGEMAEYALHGRRVVPRALQQAGFQFRHPNINSALRT